MDGTFHVHRLRASRGVGRLNESLLFCLRKDVALCYTASQAWVGGRWGQGRGWTIRVDGTFCVHRLREVGV
ncbi:hypothetical protein [Desulfosporosinus sp. Sb-LF]|uniref:hypothetical protein n=1 Tax=Desulfosporosinus sp. Sb-LF TaxID=2560027 RepID=UPI00107F53FF|nr:hypothetical protein [Desulfosporosinus sp. Sb-LF]TGE32541.1 hypothetical protein E4K68_10135 [Desulfosporosinus sp. Sb-LF]